MLLLHALRFYRRETANTGQDQQQGYAPFCSCWSLTLYSRHALGPTGASDETRSSLPTRSRLKRLSVVTATLRTPTNKPAMAAFPQPALQAHRHLQSWTRCPHVHAKSRPSDGLTAARPGKVPLHRMLGGKVQAEQPAAAGPIRPAR